MAAMHMLEHSVMTLPPFTAHASPAKSPRVRFRHVIINVLFSILYSFFAYSFFNQWLQTGNVSAFLLTIQETIIMAFVLFRRHSFEETNVLWEGRNHSACWYEYNHCSSFKLAA